ncbi:GNAT family N-acetyltransferase [Micrococcaceae bacterium RIT802]|nr:GNAT family N-acetyltransferase [Micrococcaceae bacterium RIT 802]
MFSPEITAFWQAPFHGETIRGTDNFTVTINPTLAPDRPVEVLTRHDGTVAAVVTVEVAARLGLPSGAQLDAGTFRERLAHAGLELYDPDCLFYFTDEATAELWDESTPEEVRQLTSDDADLFSRFTATASAADLDEAYVELDHWAVFGALAENRLACVASAYPWREGKLADIGVLTLPQFRGRGLARNVVRSISRRAYSRGYVPQYRCQPSNAGSRAVAAAAGLTYFGLWEVVLQNPEDA